MPYDDEKRIAKKLEGLRFRLDRRTGAIVVDDEAVFHAAGGRDESLMALVGKRGGAGVGRMEAVNEEGKLEEEEGGASASGSGSRTPLTRGADVSA
ncbi:hypothetical protein OF83DRAFT_1127751 [Amylostereum chailletii]|nr:hypothetical protein OF83DRAFT_1127751 [Amylostereum chailletii]